MDQIAVSVIAAEGLVVDSERYSIIDTFCYLGGMLSSEGNGGCSNNNKSEVCSL